MIKVWDAATGREALTFRGHTNTVHDVVFSPDGRRIVSGDYDGVIKVWDAVTGQEALTFRGHTTQCQRRGVQPGRAAHRLRGL